MKKIANSALDLVGNTPMVELSRLGREAGAVARVVAKVELFNPAGSVKDRIALAMVEEAEARGTIRPGATIIEPTSGNTGVGLALVSALKGYKLILTMPETMSVERRQMIAAFGAELVLTDGKKGMAGAIAEAERLHRETKNSLICGQFVNPANPAAHYKTTGPEIWADTEGKADIFVAGVGTGGTVTGVGRYLKEKKPSIKVIAAEPASSPVLEGGKSGPHKIQGIGAGFVPKILDTKIYDEVIGVENEKAYEWARILARKEGILAGISSGAALFAAVQVCARKENEGKTAVVLLPDTGDRYLSCGLFEQNS